MGFTESVGIGDLVALGKAHGLWVLDDIGSGALAPNLPAGLPGWEAREPTIAESLAAGADLVLASGDKLLGGPQCGLMLGSTAAIDRVQSDPLMRAVRVDKLTLAALEATLLLMRSPERAALRIPLWAFLTVSPDVLRDRAEHLAVACRAECGCRTDVVETAAMLGGGSVPIDPIPSFAVRLSPPFPHLAHSEQEVVLRLRQGEPSVVPRVQGGNVLFDLRACAPRKRPGC